MTCENEKFALRNFRVLKRQKLGKIRSARDGPMDLWIASAQMESSGVYDIPKKIIGNIALGLSADYVKKIRVA